MTLVELEPQQQSLESLTATANREHREAERLVGEALTHAISCGAALLAIRDQVGFTDWRKWLADNFEGSPAIASMYMRAAHYRDRLEGVDSLAGANRRLHGLPPVGVFKLAMDDASDIVREVKELRTAGLTQCAIAETVGRSQTQVSRILNPEQALATKRRNEKVRRARQAAVRRDEKRQEIEQARRKASGPVSHAFGNLRKVAQNLEQAIGDSSDAETKMLLRQALTDLYRVEDRVVQVVRSYTN